MSSKNKEIDYFDRSLKIAFISLILYALIIYLLASLAALLHPYLYFAVLIISYPIYMMWIKGVIDKNHELHKKQYKLNN